MTARDGMSSETRIVAIDRSSAPRLPMEEEVRWPLVRFQRAWASGTSCQRSDYGGSNAVREEKVSLSKFLFGRPASSL